MKIGRRQGVRNGLLWFRDEPFPLHASAVGGIRHVTTTDGGLESLLARKWRLMVDNPR